MVWNPVLIILFCWTATVAPFKMAFIDDLPFYYQVIDSVIDTVIVIDILITFRTAYKDKNDKLIDDSYKIAVNYIKTWLLLDVMAVFPY